MKNDSVGEPDVLYFTVFPGTVIAGTPAQVAATDDVGTVVATSFHVFLDTLLTFTFPRPLVRVLTPGVWDVANTAITFNTGQQLSAPLHGDIEDA